MSSLDFNEHWLHLIWVVLAIAAIGVWGAFQKRRALRIFAAARLLPRLSPRMGWGRTIFRLVLVTLCLLLIAAGLADPRWGEREQTITRRNIDVMVVLDVSRSMLARDIAPNRLERAKLSIRDDLLPALGGDRIGLISFAGATSMSCPLTNDYGFFRLALDDVSVRSAPRGGSLIGDAIRTAAKAFPEKLGTHKVVLLITDGEDQASEPVGAAAAMWADQGIPLVAVALGDQRDGARIPIDAKEGEKYLEYEGEVVWTKANFDDLRQMARVGGGEIFERAGRRNFIDVGTRNFDLGEIYRDVILPAIDAQEQMEAQRVPRPPRMHWFALAAFIVLLIDSLLRDSPRRVASAGAVMPAEQERAA